MLQSLLQFWSGFWIPKRLLTGYLEHYGVYDLFPGCWFHTFFFHPYLGKGSNLPTSFSDGLKPPTSFSVFLFPLGTFSAPCQVPIMAFSPLEDPSCLPEHCKELAVAPFFFSWLNLNFGLKDTFYVYLKKLGKRMEHAPI